MREPGFYWVRFWPDEEWMVAYWGSGKFHVAGLAGHFMERNFHEIDERRIVREGE